MNWHYKALVQRGFSMVPFGEQLNYYCQRHIMKDLPSTDAMFASILSFAKGHLTTVGHYLDRPLAEAIFYEFGAGWDLTVPLAFYASGVECQILVDIRNIVKSALVNDTICKLQGSNASTFRLLRKPGQFLKGGNEFVSSLKKSYGIEYRAPCDARHTGIETGSIDCITSTDTLEHIPPRDIQAILRECHRLLRDGGVMSFRIDYDDHYSYFDRRISRYNFLRYSDSQWAICNPKLHFQNRLRHRDYLELFREAGFDTVEEQRTKGTASDLETIARLSLYERFKQYSIEDMAVHNACVSLQKRLV